uniref:Uncharacterized protein n=1 Tax=Lepeophtheirus salmonis TaxID=72036 RepID=A0A0K2T0U1_LEPSM
MANTLSILLSAVKSLLSVDTSWLLQYLFFINLTN